MNESKIPHHVLHVRFTGKLTANEVNAYRSTLEAKMKEQSHIGMVVDLTELSDISAEGLSAGIQADMALLSNIDQFYRIALVSDKEWPGVLIDLIQSLLSKPEFKVFASSQRNVALEWAAKLPITEVKSMREPSMRLIHSSKENVMGFEINGAVSADAVSALIPELNKFLDANDKVRLLARIEHFNGVDPTVFMHRGLWPMKLVAMQKVERYAVVGAPGWIQKLIEVMRPMFPDIDMRSFSADKETQAWQWLEAKAVE